MQAHEAWNFKDTAMNSFPSFLTLVAVLTAFSALGPVARAQPVGGTGFSEASAVAAIVKVPRPWYAPRWLVARKMRDTIDEYGSLPGLGFKAYSFARADGHYGGIYLWKDLASARAWFSPAWFSRVERERGAPGQVRFFEVLAVLDNTPGGTGFDKDSPAVSTLVEVPVADGQSRQQVAARLLQSAAADRAVAGLMRRYFIVSDQGTFGAISLWKDEASARAALDAAWSDRMLRESGRAPQVEWFDTPILLPSRVSGNRLPDGMLVGR